MTIFLTEQITHAFTTLAQQGIDTFIKRHTNLGTPQLSHICFKFTGPESYAAYVASARNIGSVTSQIFKGKEITWCQLHTPLHQGGLTLEWLELVEPKEEANSFDGVTSIGYAVPNLSETVKLPSGHPDIFFRYQENHASMLAKP